MSLDAQGKSVYVEDREFDENLVAHCDAFNPGANNDRSLHYYGVDQDEAYWATCIYQDPLFVDLVDFRLKLAPPSEVSPCIDSGHNPGSAPYDKVPGHDYDLSPRPVDVPGVPNYGADAYCDMGAYERQQ